MSSYIIKHLFPPTMRQSGSGAGLLPPAARRCKIPLDNTGDMI